MPLRSRYLTAFMLTWLAIFACGLVPAFAVVLKGWYFPGFIALVSVGLWISFACTCPSCSLSVAWRKIPFNGATLYGCSPSFPAFQRMR